MISPVFPAELLIPVAVPTRQALTLKDVGLLIVDYDEALTEANSKITAIAMIDTEFKKRIEN